MNDVDNLLDMYRKEVINKYQIYNSLYTNLPYDQMRSVGTIVPFLQNACEKGFAEGFAPIEIIDDFFSKNFKDKTEKQRIDLLFKIIQYVEREVVLFDSIEDAAFVKLYRKYAQGTIFDLHQQAKTKNKINEIREKLNYFKVRVVFTAHPTQFYPNTVLRIIYALEEAIKDDNISDIDPLLQQLGLTPFINSNKPTPLDEALSIIYYMRHIYYDTLGNIQDAIRDLFFSKNENIKPVLELGFWPGGDRDGNPFVTAEITKQVILELRTSIMKCYYKDLKKIMRISTFKDIYSKLSALKDKLYYNMFSEYLDISADDILSVLTEVKEELILKFNSLNVKEVNNLIGKVKLFDVHFASLDIRQDSSIHYQVLKAVTQKFNLKLYDKMSEAEKVNLLLYANISLKDIVFEEEIINETFKNIFQLKDIQRENGKRAIHRYIISNSTSMLNVLEVLGLFRFCDYKNEDIHFDIVPLFETMEGLNACEQIMKHLYTNEFYSAHLLRRNNTQHIMLGFSDGTKDGGYLQANYQINQAKEILTKISRQYNIKVIFFDGRGGPPARGGGKTHEFYASQGSAIESHEIQLTIQGQTITSTYGSKPQAFFNFSQLLTAGLYSEIEPVKNLTGFGKKYLNELSELSFKKYEALKAHPKFIPYLENKSTLKYYGRTNIGSRPTKRNKETTLKFSDLRAIPFVGSWALLKQNVPGYFGLGTAIQQMIDNGKEADLKNLYQESPFFEALLQNSMMALSKTYFPLTAYMKKDKEFGEFWQILFDEYQLTIKNLLRISGMKSLMEDAPLNKVSIEQREKIILPLLAIQQYALQKIETNENVEIYEKIVTRALFGNINASRNSA